MSWCGDSVDFPEERAQGGSGWWRSRGRRSVGRGLRNSAPVGRSPTRLAVALGWRHLGGRRCSAMATLTKGSGAAFSRLGVVRTRSGTPAS